MQDDENTSLFEIDGITENIGKKLIDSNIETVMDLMEADEESLIEIKGISESMVEKIYSAVQQFIEREHNGAEDDESIELNSSDEEE